MKQLREWGLLIWILMMTVGGLIQLRAIEDLQHDIKRLEAMIASHEGSTR